jgi:hypothetical protein
MSVPKLQIGRLGVAYVMNEGSYGAGGTFASTDAYRHLNIALKKKKNRAKSPDRYGHPSLVQSLTRRISAEFSTAGLLFPSGTLNTLPDNDPFLASAFGGTTRNVTLSTTFTGTPTTTTGTVASATGLAVNDPVLINIATGANAGKYVRWLTVVAGANLTWAPPLPGAPAAADTLKGCIGYVLGSATPTTLPPSLTIARYLTDMSFQGIGAVPDVLKIMFDSNDEVRWECSGPMKDRTRPATSAKPGAFTVVGNNPPSGLTGGFTIDGSAEDYIKAVFTLTNQFKLDNFAGGTATARNFYRAGERAVQVDIDSVLEDDTTVLDLSENNGGDTPILVQSGSVEGSIIACYCPKVEIETPDDTDNDALLDAKYSGFAKGSATGNDELFVAFA